MLVACFNDHFILCALWKIRPHLLEHKTVSRSNCKPIWLESTWVDSAFDTWKANFESWFANFLIDQRAIDTQQKIERLLRREDRLTDLPRSAQTNVQNYVLCSNHAIIIVEQQRFSVLLLLYGWLLIQRDTRTALPNFGVFRQVGKAILKSKS